MRLTTIALGMAIGLGWVGVAVGQATPQLPNVQNERQMKFEGRVASVYDTNSARGTKVTADRRNLKQNDITTTPTVTVGLVQPIGQQALFLNGAAGYDFHARNTRLDRSRVNVTAGAVATLGPCRPIISGTFSAAQSDISDLDLGTTANRQTINGVSAGAQCGQGVGFGGTIIAQRADTKNSSSRQSLQDRTAESLFGSVMYGAPSLADVSLFYVYANNEFPNRVNSGRPVGDGFWTQTVGLRVSRKFGSRLTAGASGSETLIKREYSTGTMSLKQKSATYGADATYQIGRRLQFDLNANRSVRPSDRPGKLFDVADTIEGSLRYKLGSRFNISFGHTYADVVSNLDTAQARAAITSSLTNATFGSLEFRSVGNGAVILDVRRERRVTNIPDFNYISTRVGLTTAASF